jgi:hypothetical protein
MNPCVENAKNQARKLLSDKDCARFLQQVLDALGIKWNRKNLDYLLKSFDAMKMTTQAAPGDKLAGQGFTAHVAEIGSDMTCPHSPPRLEATHGSRSHEIHI